MEVDPRRQQGPAPGSRGYRGATALAQRRVAAGGNPSADEVETLYRIARFAPRAPSEEGVVADVVQFVAQVIPCERAIICRHDAGANQMVVHQARGDAGHLPLWEPSIVRRVFLSGAGEIVNDVLADPDSATLTPEFLDARHMAVAPLGVSGSRLGVIAALNSTHGAFADHDLEMLSILGDRAAC